MWEQLAGQNKAKCVDTKKRPETTKCSAHTLGFGFPLRLNNVTRAYEGDPNADGAVHVVSPCALGN